jgi:hypothetical protein
MDSTSRVAPHGKSDVERLTASYGTGGGGDPLNPA